jgi:hypothetical protein
MICASNLHLEHVKLCKFSEALHDTNVYCFVCRVSPTRTPPAKASAPAAPPPPAAEEQALDYEVDYDEVESPPYDVDYDAEKSPPYKGVSRRKGAGAAAATRAAGAAQTAEQQQQPLTPERTPTAAGSGHFGRSADECLS